MRKMVIMSNNCQECVFHRKKCILGHKRPWNAVTCDDYRPYCLVCNYPKVFCNTCRNLGFKHLKPMDGDLSIEHDPLTHAHYECVWVPPQMARQ
ncbi:hypothetical protein GM415_10950 [Pseudodesulfovibrio cashew]|uniref:Uncharacterized protein n=1 Tax=Pseudodesulfovibrio cashew TaxID=2678688 RepID=A0A6I6JI38_9BACT|nr:hypothetical protein [Pseudodesulfovibrio cashew]QGY40618.1 hypothetical protein GM415_10950 [Pseudodesulfovibrio cashew]